MSRASVIAIAAVSILVGIEANASAKVAPRIAVVTMDRHAALGLRLGAEIAELGYAVVPISPEETHDGAVLANSLERADAVAALTLEESEDGVVACVVERATMHRSCRQVADRNERLDDGSIATRSVELLRTLVDSRPPPPPAIEHQIEPNSATKMRSQRTASASPSPSPSPPTSMLAAHAGPGIFLTSGAPAELVAAIGLEWISISHLAFGVDASLPIAGSSIARQEGSASIRGSTFALHADARARVGRFEAEVGAGAGLLWLQVNGTATQTPSPSASFIGVDDSLVDPYLALHAAGKFFLDRTIALRVDATGAYVLERAEIRFASQNEAEIGRPMLTSTLSLAITWP